MNKTENKKSKIEKFKSEIPYAELDKNIVKLVKTLNGFDGVYTVDSCGGHKNNKPYQLPLGKWNVIFNINPSKKGFLALELLVWAVNNSLRRNGNDVFITPYASPPFLNGYGKSLYFILEGEDVAPDKIAEELDEIVLEFYD